MLTPAPTSLHVALWLIATFLFALACTTGSTAHDDAGPPDDGGLELVALEIEPDEVALTSVDGSTPSARLRVYGVTADGTRTEVTPTSWGMAHERVGAVDAAGTFTASGSAGGAVEVSATYLGPRGPLGASATVHVQLELTVPPGPGVPAGVEERFRTLPEEEDPFAAATVIYPLDGARMPNNVRAPDVQWHPIGGDGDAFRVTMTTEHARVRSFVADLGDTFESHFTVPDSTFRVIADTARGSEVEIRVDRLPAGEDRVIPGYPVRIWLSRGGIFGTVYYWEVRSQPDASDVLRLDAATGERASVFGTSTGQCVGCHALSHDGRRLAATRAGGPPWATAIVDAASANAPPPSLMDPISPAFNTFAWSPNGDRILASRAVTTDRSDTRLFLLDGHDARVLSATGLPSERAGYPAWSPDGRLVAWMEGGGDGPSGTDQRTRIVVAEVGEDGAFAPRALHDGADVVLPPEGGQTDSRPTFSPDSRFVAFAHGTRSVSSNDTIVRPRASLYLAPVDAAEREGATRLTRGMGAEGETHAFWPVFSPFATREDDGTVHYWLAFYSRMAYGNERAGTRGSDRRQLWVMAIDPERAAAGEDPSYPPYWLPGQDTEADDIAAIWAPTGCRPRGERCSASSECCAGECAAVDPSRPDLMTCQPPRVCRSAGASCESAADCCAGLECNLGVCDYQPPF